MLLSEKSFFLFFKRSDTEIADVFGHVHAVPVFVEWHDSGEVCEWHTVSVLGWGRGWSVGVNVSIDPDDFTVVSGKFLHTSDGTNSLGVVTTEHDWIEAFLKSFVGLVSELSRRSDNVLDVLGISKFFFAEDFTSCLGFLNFIEVAIWA